MAKYWLFLDNQVTGPYGAEELKELPGFGPEALICPEGRKGTDMGDWQRADLVPELKDSHRLATQALASPGDIEAQSPGLLPDVSRAGTEAKSGEKISSLEMAFGGLHEQLRKDEDDMLNLHRILDDERKSLDNWVRDLNTKVSRIEERMGDSLENSRKDLDDFRHKILDMEQAVASINALKEQVEAAQRAQNEAQSLAHDQARASDDLKRRIEELQSEISLLRGNAFGVGSGPDAKTASGITEPTSFNVQDIPQPSDAAALPPMASSAENLGGVSSAPSEPGSFGSFSLPPFSSKPQAQAQPDAFAAVPGLEGALPPPSVGLPTEALGVAAGIPGAVDIVSQAPARPGPGKSKGKAFVWIGLVLAVVAVLLVYEEGMIPTGMKKAGSPPSEPTAQAPAASVETPSASVEEGFKKQALSLVQGWTLPDGKTIAAAMQPMAGASANLNPWMAEKVSDGVYQVNFYGSQPQGGPVQSYEFEARLDDHQVIGLNKLAQDLLAPSPPVIHHARKPKIHRKVAGKVVSKKAKATKPNMTLPGLEGTTPQTQPQAQQSQSAGKTNGQAQDAQLLDNLLKP